MKNLKFKVLFTIIFACILSCITFSAIAKHHFNKTNHLNQDKNTQKPIIALSPDHKWMAYTKESDFIVPRDCFFTALKGKHGYEIWIIDLENKKKSLLVKNHFSCNDMDKIILDPHHLEFSIDSKTLFFQTSAWIFSDAIHAVDVDGKNLRFITDGNRYKLIQYGANKGNLLVTQQRYRAKGKSYDAVGLFTPEGKRITSSGNVHGITSAT